MADCEFGALLVIFLPEGHVSGARAAHARPGDGELLLALREGLSPWLSIRSPPFRVRGGGERMGMAPLVAYPRLGSCPDWSKQGKFR